jgi:hypothetical protein
MCNQGKLQLGFSTGQTKNYECRNSAAHRLPQSSRQPLCGAINRSECSNEAHERFYRGVILAKVQQRRLLC